MSGRSLRAEHASRNLDRLRHHLGDEVLALLMDRRLVELSANPDGKLWADYLGEPGMRCVGAIDRQRAELFITSAAAILDVCIDRRSAPELAAELPAEEPWRGARLQALLPPVAPAPCFSLRMHASAVITLAEYEERGIMRSLQRQAIETAIAARQAILVVGETGSGKTTLLNAIIARIAELSPLDRLVILEDTTEIQCVSANKVQLHTSGDLGMDALLRTAMRLRPDRIVVGEVRGKEALTFVKAVGTGHTGYCTVHSGSALGGLYRLEALIQEASVTPQKQQIAHALDLVVVIRRDRRSKAGRYVREVAMLDTRLAASGDYVLTLVE